MSLRNAHHRHCRTPAALDRGRPTLLRFLLTLLAVLFLATGANLPAAALEPIEVTEEIDGIDITSHSEPY
jgi:hypothetical protein